MMIRFLSNTTGHKPFTQRNTPTSLLLRCLMLTLFCFLQLAGQEHPVVQKSFDKIPWKTGSHTYSVKNQYGKKWDMRISFPKKDVNPSGVPLIIALHWAGSGDTFEIFHDCLVVPGTKDLDAILVSPEGEDQLWNTLNNINKVKIGRAHV